MENRASCLYIKLKKVSTGFQFLSAAQVLQSKKLNAHVPPMQVIMVTFAISVNSFPPQPCH